MNEYSTATDTSWLTFSFLPTVVVKFLPTVALYAVGHKNTPFFHHNLKESHPILISFGTNISDTTGHQMIV